MCKITTLFGHFLFYFYHVFFIIIQHGHEKRNQNVIIIDLKNTKHPSYNYF